MRTDVQGCSTCPAGEEQYEEFYDTRFRGRRVQYDYRTPVGRLFSCVAKTLEEARERRNAWLSCAEQQELETTLREMDEEARLSWEDHETGEL